MLDEPGIPNCDDCGGGKYGCGDEPLVTYYQDFDFDGYGNVDSVIENCFQPIATFQIASIGDDTRTMVNPDAPETCNGVDDDCNNAIDDGLLGLNKNVLHKLSRRLERPLTRRSETLWVGSDEGSAAQIFGDYGNVASGWSFIERLSYEYHRGSLGQRAGESLGRYRGFEWCRQMQSRGEDIRFFTNDAGLLSYWLGQRTDLGQEVWVTIPHWVSVKR